jgi:hypothetical protein
VDDEINADEKYGDEKWKDIWETYGNGDEKW